MTELADPRLSAWQNFYVILGSSGAALIGIQFVVITLIAYRGKPPQEDTVNAFGTPTVVHLAAALLLSAIMTAPWSSLAATAIAIGICGFAGLAYGAIVLRRARRQTGYKPVFEDWLWHIILPFMMYAALAASGVLVNNFVQIALFVIGASALGLLFIGIHNAWDTVTHIVVTSPGGDHTD